MPDTIGSECSGKGRGSHVGQKHFEKSEKESTFFYLVPQYTCPGFSQPPIDVCSSHGLE